ncbi:MAG: hypothetical protein IJ343_10355 [Clostridia bacterium]|nr:hypothetical protein [Clostridia bacterium]
MEQYEINRKPAQGSILRGLIGALLGAILGGVLWGVIGILTQQVFIVAGLGLGFLVAGGYTLFKGREGAAKIVIVALCVILAVVLGEGLYNVGMIEQEFRAMPQYVREYLQEEGYNVASMSEETLQMFNSMLIPSRDEFYLDYLHNADWQSNAVTNLGQALLFAALGAVGVIISLGKKNKETPETEEVTVASRTPVEFNRIDDDSTSA